MPTKNNKRLPNGARPVWGAYIPDIQRSYPDMPVRGYVTKGKYSQVFLPDQSEPKPKHSRNPELRYWITGDSYDLVVQKMRETADDAIKELKAGIQRLERFIDNN